MGRGTRLYYSYAVYHVAIRGNNRQAILKADEDKNLFLAQDALDNYLYLFELRHNYSSPIRDFI